jgi:hypothetical protein
MENKEPNNSLEMLKSQFSEDQWQKLMFVPQIIIVIHKFADNQNGFLREENQRLSDENANLWHYFGKFCKQIKKLIKK